MQYLHIDPLVTVLATNRQFGIATFVLAFITVAIAAVVGQIPKRSRLSWPHIAATVSAILLMGMLSRYEVTRALGDAVVNFVAAMVVWVVNFFANPDVEVTNSAIFWVGLLLAAIGIYVFYSNPGWRSFLVMALLVSSFFAGQTVQGVMDDVAEQVSSWFNSSVNNA